MERKIKEEKGFLSIFVILVMIFLLVFVLLSYAAITERLKREQIKDIELQELYMESNNSDIENYVYANSNDVIPIYNIKELNRVGTGNSIQIKDLIYQCGISNSYVLKSDIWVDVEEDLILNNIGFSDFKLYDSVYTIDTAGKDIYYYYEYEKGNVWKAIAYQKFTEKDNELVSNKTYLQNKFSIVNMVNYQNLEDLTFMMIWSSKDGSLSNYEIIEQDYVPARLEEIEVFKENYEYVDSQAGEFYVLVNI